MYEDEISDDLVTIAQFAYPYQAHLLAGNLEAEGIMAFVHGENMNSVYPFLTNLGDGIHVKVKESEKEAALAIKRRIEETATPSTELPPAINVNGNIFDLVRGNCPECGEATVYMQRADAFNSFGVAAVIVALAVPLKINANYICYSCQYNWVG